MTLSPKIENQIRNSVEQFLNKLRSCPTVERVDCTFEGNNSLVIRAIHETRVKAVEIPPVVLDGLVNSATGYVAAKGYISLMPVYEEKVRKAILEYAMQGVEVKQVIVKGDKHPFRVTYMAKQ